MIDRLWRAYADQWQQLHRAVRELAALRRIAKVAESFDACLESHEDRRELHEALARYHDLQADK